MHAGKRVLAVVPARSGSKGIRDKNMKVVAGMTLIERAAKVLARVPELDARVLSTDSERYAQEAMKHDLDAPFLRPAALSGDQAGAVETMQHAVRETERLHGMTYDVVLIIEPTSPLRTAEDISGVIRLLIDSGADSVVTVSVLPTKSHPLKLLTVRDGKLTHYIGGGEQVVARQQLDSTYVYRDGVCYAMTRACLMERAVIFTENTLPFLTPHPVVNIDEPIELRIAEWLLEEQAARSSSL